MVEELSLHNSRRNNEYSTVLQATSDDQLASVAQRLQEQLETTTVLSSTAPQEEAAAAGIGAHLSSSSDAAAAMACSSSDLSGWIEGMIEELTASNGQHNSRSPLVTTDSPHCTHNILDSLLDTTGFPSQQALLMTFTY